MLNRHWEMGPPRGAAVPPPYHIHRTMREVLDQELIAERDDKWLAAYRAELRKPTKDDDNGTRPPTL